MIILITLPDVRYLFSGYLDGEGPFEAPSFAYRLLWATGMTFTLLGIVIAVSATFKIADWVMARR